MPGSARVIQCAANFSEGRDEETISAIVSAASAIVGVRVADWSADGDHNRMVVTLIGEPTAVSDAALAMADIAVARIDLARHTGAHPRLGAVDVVPFIPLVGVTLADCAEIAREFASRIASALALPVFLYEAASPTARTLPDIRKRAFTKYAPDYGPPAPHPTAGALVCGARGPLIAFNANLVTADIAIAKKIATALRAEYPGKVRALGLALESRSIAQVSMNIVRPAEVSLTDLIAFIEALAPIDECELIGALPGYTALEATRTALRLPSLRASQVILETWPE